jgi:hypothetical protein
MEFQRSSRLFGSRRRTEVLLLTALLGETYPAELARLLGARLFPVQQIVRALEAEGVFATGLSGGTRRVKLDPRHYAAAEIRALLLRLAEGEPEIGRVAASRRSRPRRSGKKP